MTACLLVWGFWMVGRGAAGPQTAPIGEAADDRLDRGEYLVHRVAMCVECHSPRDARGRLDRDRLLVGGRIPVAPPHVDQAWALFAPRLAGLPGWQRQDVIALLHTGRTPQGFSPRPPMPPFRLSQEDAAAVVAYLESYRR